MPISFISINSGNEAVMVNRVHSIPVEDWASIRNGDGTGEWAPNDSAGMHCYSTEDKWYSLSRSIMLFDTSELVGSIPTSAYLRLYKISASMTAGMSINPTVNIYSANPASEDYIWRTDYNSLGTTPYCNKAATWAEWNASPDYYDFQLNPLGVAAINTGGITKIGFRNANYDAANVEPEWWGSYYSFFFYFNNGDSDYGYPTLVVSGGADNIKDMVTGITRRWGPGHYSMELQLGGLATNWTMLDLTKEPLPAIPSEAEGERKFIGIYSEEVNGVMRFYYLYQEADGSYTKNYAPMGGIEYLIPPGMEHYFKGG